MAEDVHLPVAGNVNRKTLIYTGSAAAGYVAWRWWRSRRAAAAAAASGAQPLPTVDTSNVAGAQGATGFTNPDPAGSASTMFNDGSLSTDAAWTSKSTTDMANLGYNAQTVATALGLYLSSQPLTPDQQMIVRVAWGLEGKPPQHTNLVIIPAQSPPPNTNPPPANNGGGSTPPPPPPPPAPTPAPPGNSIPPGYHMQDPQYAVLPAFMSLQRYAELHYPGNSQALSNLVAYNAGIASMGLGWTAHGDLSIKTSEAHLVPNR